MNRLDAMFVLNLVVCLCFIGENAQGTGQTVEIPDLSFLDQIICDCEEHSKCIANQLLRSFNRLRQCEEKKCGALLHPNMTIAMRNCSVAGRTSEMLLHMLPKAECLAGYVCRQKRRSDVSNTRIIDLVKSFVENILEKRMVKVVDGEYLQPVANYYACVKEKCSNKVNSHRIMKSCDQNGYCGHELPTSRFTMLAIKAECQLTNFRNDSANVLDSCHCVADMIGESMEMC